MKKNFKNTLKLFLLLEMGLILATQVWAVQVPDNQLLPDPEKTLGGPVVYIQLAAVKEKETTYLELKKEKEYILGYREVSLQDMNTDHPVLMTWTYNPRNKQAAKTYFNWNTIDSIQLLDPKIKVRR